MLDLFLMHVSLSIVCLYFDRGKLAVYHLRDAMRKERAVLETALQLTFFPLLEQVDPALHNHMVVKAGLSLPTFAVTWVSNWFATDVTDIAAASRLLDVFLVSHAATPLYCAVALLTCHRQRLLQCEPVLQAVSSTVKNLPLFDEDDATDVSVASGGAANTTRTTAMANVEHVIATALDYMYAVAMLYFIVVPL